MSKSEFTSWCKGKGGEIDRDVDMGDEQLECNLDRFSSVTLDIPEGGDASVHVETGDKFVDGRFHNFGFVREQQGIGYGDRHLLIRDGVGEETLVDEDGYAGDIEKFGDWL